MRICCIGDDATVRGLRLAGIAGTVVQTPTEAATALSTAAATPDATQQKLVVRSGLRSCVILTTCL